MLDCEAKGPKKTRRWVLIADRVADRFISVGGILVIAAVLGIMVFLVYEVVPLFEGGIVESQSDYALNVKREPILGLSMDEHKTIAACAMKDATDFRVARQNGHPSERTVVWFEGQNRDCLRSKP